MQTKFQKNISEYLENLKKFLDENNLPKEYFNDIAERIEEKILEQKPNSEKDVQKILTEIGSPEEIFREEMEENISSNSYENTKSVKSKNLLQKIVEWDEKKIFL